MRQSEKSTTKRICMEHNGNVPFAHVATDQSYSQQPVLPRDFPLFKYCEWLVVNYNVGATQHNAIKKSKKEERRKV